jgi:hypothetical protein
VILVLAAAALGLLLRLHFCLVAHDRTTTTHTKWARQVAFDEPNRGTRWLHDEYLYYVSTAANAFAGRGFFPQYNEVRDGVYVPPPLQPLLILGAYRLAGHVVPPPWLMAGQSLLGVLMILAAAETGRRLVSPLAGVLAALLVALYPDFVFWTAYLMTEANFLVGLALVLLLLVRWREAPTTGRAVAAALALGVLDLQRGYALYLGPLLALAAVATLGWRRARVSALAFALLPLLVLAPWLARNLAVYGEPILVSSNDGMAFHTSNFASLDAAATPFWEDAVATAPGPFLPELEKQLRNREGRLRARVTYYRYSKEYMAVARRYALRSPGHFLRNYLIKLKNAFVVVPSFAASAVPVLGTERVYRLIHGALLVGGLLGSLAALARGGPGLHLVAAVFLYFAALRGLFLLERQGRWDLPLRYFLILFLACGIGLVAEAIRRRASPPAQRGNAAGAVST